MTTRYDAPGPLARAGNDLIRRLAEAGVSIAGTTALRIRGRRTGQIRSVVVNLMTLDGKNFLVSPRGETQWVRNARAAGVVETGPRWRRSTRRLAEVPDDAKPALLQHYLARWYWEVKGHMAGLTPHSSDAELRAAAPSIPVYELLD
ncbi:nitroreductase/quinone reductase family protein [Mycobacterium aquaticum]|uniref:Nitroreductase family deazaflavin-dependent oxidoreductase n=1 Tax=Mycobacterium aquaticum TaxID=1927124 RepID=A0A1W9ZYA9_9MYCO|nr:nitroreductase/quinone reductase family protein [Mycobacterium aquaticum]ORA22761.1 nitroreductase family deazaflavin-dependent oxidoreductase [Mycobacterium aquaticum]